MWRTCFEHFLVSLSSLAPTMVVASLAPLLPLEVEKRGLSEFISNLIY